MLPPTQATEEIELAWAADHPADDEDRDNPARANVIDHAVRGLQEGGYDRRAWLRSAALGHPRGRARDVVVKWGSDNFEVSTSNFDTELRRRSVELTLRPSSTCAFQSTSAARCVSASPR